MDTYTNVKFPNMETYEKVKNFNWNDFTLDKMVGNSLFGKYGDVYVEVVKDVAHPIDLLNGSHYHEVLDRLHIILSMCDDYLLQHPVCKVDKEITREVENAVNSLSVAYQMVGNR